MRYSLPAAAAALLFGAAPLQATQGLLCRPVSGERPRLSLVIGAGGIAGASLDENGQWVSTMASSPRLILAQAWIDRDQVLADLVDVKRDRVARLRVRFQPPVPRQPRSAAGTLVLRGRSLRVRCVED